MCPDAYDHARESVATYAKTNQKPTRNRPENKDYRDTKRQTYDITL